MDKCYIVIGMQANTIDYTGYSLKQTNGYDFAAEHLTDKYVIIYSILVHEQEDVVLDLVKNIFYFNKSIPCCIILNCSIDLYSKINAKFKDVKHLYMNPKPVNKKWATYSLFEAHLDNYYYVSRNISSSFDYFIPLASNCLFHKEFTLGFLNKELDTVYDDYRISEPILHISPNNAQFIFNKTKILFENKGLVDFFESLSIKIVYSQIEGAIIDKDTMEYIYRFVTYYDLKSKITKDSHAFEEVIYGTLYMKKNKKMMPHMCKVFWKKDPETIINYLSKYFFNTTRELNVPTLDELNEINEACVKNIPRNMDNNLRVYIRTKASNYRNLPNFSLTNL